MKKVKHCTLDWRYLDTFYKVSNQVEIKSDNGYKIDIKQEEELTEKQKDFFLEICQEAFENEGYSRHFTDPVLKERLPGVAYIVGMSDPPGHFVLFCKLQKGGKAYARQWPMSCIWYTTIGLQRCRCGEIDLPEG